MAEYLDPIDISDSPELARLIDVVLQSDGPRLLRRGNEDLAIVTPLPQGSTRPAARRPKKGPDYEAFRSAAGSWAGVDTDKLIEDIYATRRRSNRPPIEL